MSTSIYKKLLENSVDAVLSAIEIYNKPDFKYREQVFTILNINAWELLLKAKILKDNGDNITSLYITLPDSTFKTNRSGNPMTIEIFGAIRKLRLNSTLTENLKNLIEIRDTAVHFFHDDAIAYAVYSLATASLKNYQKLVQDWFGRSLLEYNFYVLPISFAFNFKTLSMLELEQRPEIVTNLIRSITDTQASLNQDDDFYFACEVSTQIVSAKKFVEGSPDFVTMIDADANPDTLIVTHVQRLIDKYPLTYKKMWTQVKAAKPHIKQTTFNRFIREHQIKENPDFSAYSFRTKAHEEEYKKTGRLPTAITSIYNEDAKRYIIANISEE